MTKYVLSAGHTLSGNGSGANGYINESIETRKVVNALANYLKSKGHEVVIANVDKASSQAAYLYGVVKKANAAKPDVSVFIHFNAFNGNAHGTEVYTWRGEKLPSAVGICNELSKLGFRNRGVKNGSSYYVVRNTNMPALLVETCFVDSKNDTDLYKKLGVSKVAEAIGKGLLN